MIKLYRKIDVRHIITPVYVVRGKVIFILGNVCLFTIGGGYPSPGLGGGYPIPGLGGGTLSQVWMVGGTPSQVWMVGEGYPIPGLDGGEGTLSHV